MSASMLHRKSISTVRSEPGPPCDAVRSRLNVSLKGSQLKILKPRHVASTKQHPSCSRRPNTSTHIHTLSVLSFHVYIIQRRKYTITSRKTKHTHTHTELHNQPTHTKKPHLIETRVENRSSSSSFSSRLSSIRRAAHFFSLLPFFTAVLCNCLCCTRTPRALLRSLVSRRYRRRVHHTHTHRASARCHFRSAFQSFSQWSRNLSLSLSLFSVLSDMTRALGRRMKDEEDEV